MLQNLPELCQKVLTKTFGDAVQISLEDTGAKGEGYVSDMFFLNLEMGEEILHLVVKMMQNLDQKNEAEIRPVFETEVTFYEIVWPVIDRFQRERKSKIFDKIPRYFGSATKDGQIALAMENIKAAGFLLRGKKHWYDRNLVEFSFRQFAEYHAISFALKDQKPEDFEIVRCSLKRSWYDLISTNFIQLLLPKRAHLVTSHIEDEDVKRKMRTLADRVLDEFANAVVYKGNHHALIHGDCWINNFLFQHSESGDLQDMRFVDFQIAQVGTPVYDLSYFFYTGATGEILEDLEYFLQVYHNTLSTKLLELGSDPNKLYPYDVLKQEWAEYSKFGFFISFMCWKGKTNEGAVDITNEDDLRAGTQDKSFDETFYYKVMKDLVHHMYERGFL